MSIQNAERSNRSDTLRFVREFTRAPLETAAIAPSSLVLAQVMSAPVPLSGDPVVVELGAGTGAFTNIIQQKLAGRGRHMAIELNPRWVDLLRERYPRVEVIRTEAGNLPDVLDQYGAPAADVIVSGLPWVSYREGGSGSLTESIAASLHENGAFTQFNYSWTRWTQPARTRLQELRNMFEEVSVSATVWRNAPPAIVYTARRARKSVIHPT